MMDDRDNCPTSRIVRGLGIGGGMGKGENPFGNRGVITKGDEFFGREEELDRICECLRHMQCTAVVGRRRIGKSSLLRHLTRIGKERLGSEYRFIYIDHQKAQFRRADRWLEEVARCVSGEAHGLNGETLDDRLIAFSRTIADCGEKVVLCLDELERVFRFHREGFGEDFFDHMRAQISERRVAFVTATEHSLQTLCFNGQLVSPFYDVFVNLVLREFSGAEAQQFVDAHRERVKFTRKECDFIRHRAECHPLRLQIVCYHVVRSREHGMSDVQLVKDIEREIANCLVGRYHWRRMWEGLRGWGPRIGALVMDLGKWLIRARSGL